MSLFRFFADNLFFSVEFKLHSAVKSDKISNSNAWCEERLKQAYNRGIEGGRYESKRIGVA